MRAAGKSPSAARSAAEHGAQPIARAAHDRREIVFADPEARSHRGDDEDAVQDGLPSSAMNPTAADTDSVSPVAARPSTPPRARRNVQHDEARVEDAAEGGKQQKKSEHDGDDPEALHRALLILELAA